MSTQNTVIAQIAADFTKLQTDFVAFSTLVKAFIASVQSGSTGTVLSTVDAATLASIDTGLQGMDATVAGITVPTPPAAA